MLQLGSWATTPASSPRLPRWLQPRGQDAGKDGLVADSLFPRWLTQSAGSPPRRVAPWRHATLDTPTSARFPPPWSAWGNERVMTLESDWQRLHVLGLHQEPGHAEALILFLMPSSLILTSWNWNIWRTQTKFPLFILILSNSFIIIKSVFHHKWQLLSSFNVDHNQLCSFCRPSSADLLTKACSAKSLFYDGDVQHLIKKVMMEECCTTTFHSVGGVLWVMFRVWFALRPKISGLTRERSSTCSTNCKQDFLCFSSLS